VPSSPNSGAAHELQLPRAVVLEAPEEAPEEAPGLPETPEAPEPPQPQAAEAAGTSQAPTAANPAETAGGRNGKVRLVVAAGAAVAALAVPLAVHFGGDGHAAGRTTAADPTGGSSGYPGTAAPGEVYRTADPTHPGTGASQTPPAKGKTKGWNAKDSRSEGKAPSSGEAVKEPAGKADSGAGRTSASSTGGHSTASGDKTAAHSSSTSHTGSSSAHTAAPPPAAPTYQILGIGSGLCIAPVSGSAGARLSLEPCGSSARTQWSFGPGGTIRSQGMCMDVSGTGPEAAVIRTTCDGGSTQRFDLNGSNDLTNDASGNLCVDAEDGGTSAGTPLQLWQCEGSDNQKWKSV
jgi:hypothetical protein